MSVVSELRRRNVVRVAIFYAVASWLIQQLAREALQLQLQLQLKQIDDVLFVQQLARGSPLPPM